MYFQWIRVVDFFRNGHTNLSPWKSKVIPAVRPMMTITLFV